jgi:cytochrome P450
MSTTDETRNGWYASRAAFVTTEFDLATTFATIALGSAFGSDKRLRNERHAWTAYESAIRFLSRTDLSPTDAERLAAKQQQLEDLLQQLTGEPHS